jgi:uncharacterized protein YjiS (DUF1127 family)
MFTYSQYSLSKRIIYSQLLIGAIMTTYSGNCSRSLAGESVGVLDTLLEKFCIRMKNQLLKVRIHQERRQLQSMSEAMLKDLGISRADAMREAQRTDLPAARLANR